MSEGYSKTGLLPVHPSMGAPLTSSEITAPGIKYYDAVSKSQLSGPAVWGDVSPDGIPYHGGVHSEIFKGISNVISYHNPHSWW
jgi:hypothetical protein